MTVLFSVVPCLGDTVSLYSLILNLCSIRKDFLGSRFVHYF